MSSSNRIALAALALSLPACATLPPEAAQAPSPEQGSSQPSTLNVGDAPEISGSTGTAGGVLVFWPRVVPRAKDPTGHDLAVKLQERVAEVARKAAPGHPIDVRPEPERVCPRAGCTAITVGVLLTRSGDSCAAMALVSGSGTSPARILPWAGQVQIRNQVVPFREPPESQVKVDDFVPCATLVDSLGAREGEIVEYIKGLVSNP